MDFEGIVLRFCKMKWGCPKSIEQPLFCCFYSRSIKEKLQIFNSHGGIASFLDNPLLPKLDFLFI